MTGFLRALPAIGRYLLLLAVGTYPACVLYVPTDDFRQPTAGDAGEDGSPSPRADAGDNAYRDVVLSDTPVAYWRLEENGGPTAHDETGHGHDATFVGAFAFAQRGVLDMDEGNHAVDFDDRSAYLVVESTEAFAFPGNATCSFEAWVKTRPSQNPYRKIFMQASRLPGEFPRAGWILSVPTTDSGTTVEYDRLRASTSSTFSGGVVPESTWTHVVLTYRSDTTATLYVNGAEVSSKSLPMSLERNGASFVIGGNTDPNGASFSGLMDELAVYDRELTAGQVDAHFRAARRGPP